MTESSKELIYMVYVRTCTSVPVLHELVVLIQAGKTHVSRQTGFLACNVLSRILPQTTDLFPKS